MNKALSYINKAEASVSTLTVADRLYDDQAFMDLYMDLKKQVELKKLEVELKYLVTELNGI